MEEMRITCPHCGHKNDFDSGQMIEVDVCSRDYGCGKLFAHQTMIDQIDDFNKTTKVLTFKLEPHKFGEDPKELTYDHEIIQFLMGAGPLLDHHSGKMCHFDEREKGSPAYWWRTNLSKVFGK